MNNKYKILLVEDESHIVNLVKALLELNGYKVISARSYVEAITLYASYIPDLVLLDLGLPDRDGTELLAEIRKQDSIPVIILSARGDEAEKVRSLDMGANDYITKPFGSAELVARVRSALRHSYQIGRASSVSDGVFRLDGLMIKYDSRQVFLDEKEIKLTQTEYNILALLSEHSGKMLTYSAIIKAIWRECCSDNSKKKLQVNMANIRKKLGINPGESKYIINELGVGYRMNGENR